MNTEVLVPKSISELWDMLEIDGAKIIAGGTDLMVRVRSGIIKPRILVDITRIPDFHVYRRDGDKIFLGSTLTHAELLEKGLPSIFLEAISTIGSPQIRNMGTIGGNVCNASPAGDGILPLYLYDANVVLLSKNGERRVHIEDFIKGPGKVELKDQEIVYGFEFLDKYKDYKYIFRKIGKRVAMTISIVSMGLIFKLKDGIINDIKIAFGAVYPTVLRMRKLEKYLIGKPIEDPVLSEAREIIMKEVSPIDDIRATAIYRRKVAGNIIFLLKERYG